MRKAKAYFHNELAGRLTENEECYSFRYDENYMAGWLHIPSALQKEKQWGDHQRFIDAKIF